MDTCLFLSKKVICVVYVDDCLIFARDTADIDAAIERLKGNRFKLRVEDDAACFLGIELDHQEDGSIELKQTALIQRIVDTIGFQNASGKATPAEGAELPADVDGPGP
eukprot:5262067-Ditylum_brightwellii.AAC.1